MAWHDVDCVDDMRSATDIIFVNKTPSLKVYF